MVILQVQVDFQNQFGGIQKYFCFKNRHPFEDEITRQLRFTGAGILAMV